MALVLEPCGRLRREHFVSFADFKRNSIRVSEGVPTQVNLSVPGRAAGRNQPQNQPRFCGYGVSATRLTLPLNCRNIAFALVILVTRDSDSMKVSAPILDYDPSKNP